MPDNSCETNRLLAEILVAIQKLDVSLQTHEQRIKDLEALRRAEQVLESSPIETGELVPPTNLNVGLMYE